MASKNSATSRESGAEPEMKKRSRPPKRLRIFRKTSRSAASVAAPPAARRAPRPSRSLRERSRPTSRAQLEEGLLGAAGLERAACTTLAWTFSKMRGTAQTKVGRIAAEVLHQLLDAAVDRGGEADAELRRPDHLAEAVGQREPEELRAGSRGRGCRTRCSAADCATQQAWVSSTPLGAAGGAGGVDEGGQRVARAPAAQVSSNAPGVRPVAGPPQLLERAPAG